MPRVEVNALLRALDRLDAPADEWLTDIARSVHEVRRGRDGVCLFEYRAEQDHRSVRSRVLRTGRDFELAPDAFHRAMSSDALRALYPAGTRVGFVGNVLLGLAEIATTVRSVLDGRGVQEVFNITASEVDRGVVFIIPSRDAVVRPRVTDLLSRVAEQVRLGVRLRGALTAGTGRGTAILTPEGRVEAIDAELAGEVPLTALRELVRARETARRDRTGRGDAERGAEWVGLLRGEWSCIDSVEQDGRRYVVVARAPAAMVPVRALDERETKIVERMVSGAPAKSIAVELGIGDAELSRAFARALAKLGLPDRAALMRAHRVLGRARSPSDSSR